MVVIAVGCSGAGKGGAFERAAAELPAARKAASAAGIPIDTTSYRAPTFPKSANGALDYRRAIAFWMGRSKEQRDAAIASWSVGTPSRSSPDFSPYETMLSAVVQGSKKKGVDFERDYSQGFDALYPEYAPMKAFAKALASRAIKFAQSGNLAAAKTDLLAVQRMAYHCALEETVISQLFSIAISKIGLKSVERIVGELGPRTAVLAMSDEVVASAPQHLFVRGIRAEIVMGTVTIRNIRSTTRIKQLAATDSQGLSGSDVADELAAKIEQAVGNVDLQIIRDAFEARHLQFWTQAITEGKSLDNEKFGELLDKLTAESNWPADPSYALNQIVNPVYGQTGKAMRGLQEQRHAFQAGIAILRSGGPDHMDQKARNLLARFELDVTRHAGGFLVASKSFVPPSLNGRVMQKTAYGFTYPYRGDTSRQ